MTTATESGTSKTFRAMFYRHYDGLDLDARAGRVRLTVDDYGIKIAYHIPGEGMGRFQPWPSSRGKRAAGTIASVAEAMNRSPHVQLFEEVAS